MKGRLLTATLPLAIAVAGCGPSVEMSAIAATVTAKVGQAAPAFTLVDSTGQTRSLAGFAGKTGVLKWINHVCPFVKKHYGAENIQAQQREATADAVVWLTVNSSAPGQRGHVGGAAAERIRGEVGAAQTAYLPDPDAGAAICPATAGEAKLGPVQ